MFFFTYFVLFWIKLKIAWKRLLVSWRFLFAHHPLCENYRDQVFVVFGIYLCQGCTLLYSGLLLGLILFIFLETSAFTLLSWFLIASLLVIPSFLTLKSKKRLFKRIARLLNGVGFSTIFWGASSLSLIQEKILLIFYMIALYSIFTLYRLRNFDQRNLCLTCEENSLLVCSGYRMQSQVEDEINDYVSKLLDSK